MQIKYTNTYFFTATILNWNQILTSNNTKDIIIQSLKYLVDNKRIVLFGFVIMPNHIHLLLHIPETDAIKAVQRDFLKFTAQQIKFYLKDYNNDKLSLLLVNAKDRKYQIWERNARVTEIENNLIFEQKLSYIHNNPLQQKWRLCESPEDYKYSSAAFYCVKNDEFDMLSCEVDF